MYPYVSIAFYEISRLGKLMETEGRLEIIRRIRGKGRMRSYRLMVIEFLSGVMKMEIVVMIVKHDECN